MHSSGTLHPQMPTSFSVEVHQLSKSGHYTSLHRLFAKMRSNSPFFAVLGLTEPVAGFVFLTTAGFREGRSPIRGTITRASFRRAISVGCGPTGGHCQDKNALPTRIRDSPSNGCVQPYCPNASPIIQAPIPSESKRMVIPLALAFVTWNCET